MIFEGSAEVTLFTGDGEITQHREVMIDAPDAPGDIAPGGQYGTRVTVVGPPMKGVDSVSAIRVVANGNRYEFELRQPPSIGLQQTVFSAP